MFADSISLSSHERVVFFTGAGLSKESGIPTYRGAGGLWGDYDYQRYACQSAFEQDPERVWTFHNLRREKVGAAKPNAAHRRIAEFQCTHPSVTIITQNIDGLHQRAGAENVIELHGSLWRVRCDACGRADEILEAPLANLRCPCGAYWRPAIIWFGDMLDPEPVERAEEALSRADLLITVGTSGVVFPAAELPRIAARRGARRVEVNPEETPMSDLYTDHLRMPATEALSEYLS